MKFVKNNIKFIIVIVICLVGSSITTLATNYLFNSNEVSYDNTSSGLHADYVQGAIDEVFQHATDYSEIKTKIGTGSLTTTSNTLIGGINELNSNMLSEISSIRRYISTGINGNTADDGIVISSASSGHSNLAENNARCVVMTYTILSNPLRKIQLQFTMTKTYQRYYADTWGSWQELAFANKEEITITPTNGVFTAQSYNRCTRVGNIVKLNVSGNVTTTSTGWNTIATFPVAYAPSTDVYFTLVNSSTTPFKLLYGYISSTGNILVNGKYSDELIRGSVSWVIKG